MKYPIPADALDDRLAFTGTSGTGKTYDAGTAIEKVLHAKSRAAIVDPLGVWWGLRLNADGKSAGFKVAIFGGPHGDIAITETSGKLIGETVAGTKESCIIDLSEFDTEASQRRFMLAFIVALYGGLKGDLLHLVLDEADMWAPQRIMDKEGDATKLHHNVQKIVRRGRVKGFIPWLITQRPAELSKSVLSQVDGIVAHQLVAPQDVKALMDWVSGHADKETLETIKTGLPAFGRGEAAVYIPRRRVLAIAQFPKKATFDSSRSPERGERKNRPDITLKPLDIEALKKRLEKVEAEAKANDPNALKAEIARLKKEAADSSRTKPATPDPKAVTKAKGAAAEAIATARKLTANNALLLKALEAAMKFIVEINAEGFFKAAGEGVDQAAIEKVIKAATEQATRLIDQRMELRNKEIDALRREGARVVDRMKKLLESLDKDVAIAVSVRHNEPFSIQSGALGGNGVAAPRRVPTASGDGALKKAERLILTALAQYAEGRTKNQVAILTGYAVNGGGFNNALSALRSTGRMDGSGDWLQITEEGLSALGAFDPLPHGAELLDHWMRQLGKAERSALEIIASAYPSAMSKEAVAEQAGYAADGGGFNNALSRLRTFELIEGKGELRASEALFG